MHYDYEYFEQTSKIDMTKNYCFFLQYFHGNSILDLGCGSGRDSNYFKQQKYEVSSVDNSEYAKQFASQKYKVEVDLVDIEQNIKGVFDGIWSCASLVHMNQHQILKILEQLKNNLYQGGLIYISLKYGNGILSSNDQIYYLYNETIIEQIIKLGYKLRDVNITTNESPMNSWIEFVIEKD